MKEREICLGGQCGVARTDAGALEETGEGSVDAGLVDAGLADAGAREDAGVIEDAGVAVDGGATEDAGMRR